MYTSLLKLIYFQDSRISGSKCVLYPAPKKVNTSTNSTKENNRSDANIPSVTNCHKSYTNKLLFWE